MIGLVHIANIYFQTSTTQGCHSQMEINFLTSVVAVKRLFFLTSSLMLPIEEKPLLLHISNTTYSLGTLLTHHEYLCKERAIYYINYTLVGYELSYTHIEHIFIDFDFFFSKVVEQHINPSSQAHCQNRSTQIISI